MIGIDLALYLTLDGLTHLHLSHFLELVHLLRQTGQAVANLSALETELGLDLSSDGGLSLPDLDQGLVAHDLLALGQLTLQLLSDLRFLGETEFGQPRLHLQFQLERRFLLDEVERRVKRQSLIPEACIDLRENRPPTGSLARFELQLQAIGPFLLPFLE